MELLISELKSKIKEMKMHLSDMNYTQYILLTNLNMLSVI